MGASNMSRSLLYELMRQHDGRNNGHLHLSFKWLKTRGWMSANSIQRGKIELLERQLILKTREGGLNAGPDKYALTWLAITNYVGLHIASKDYQPGAYQLLGPFAQPLEKRQPGEPPPPPVVRTSPDRPPPRKCHSAHGNSAAPPMGTAKYRSAPPMGTRAANFPLSLLLPWETMNSYHCTGVPVVAGMARRRKRIVGKAGKSGKPKNCHATASETARPAPTINASACASLRAVDLGVGMSWATRCSVNPAMLGGEA